MWHSTPVAGIEPQADRTHRGSDPLELHVLALKEALVGELTHELAVHTGDFPVELDPQSLGEGPIVEVLAMPAAMVRPAGQAESEQEYRQDAQDGDGAEGPHGLLLEGDQQEGHEGPQQVPRPNRARKAAVVVAAQPVGGLKHPVQIVEVVGSRVGTGERKAVTLLCDSRIELIDVPIELGVAIENCPQALGQLVAVGHIRAAETELLDSRRAAMRQPGATDLVHQVVVARGQQAVGRRGVIIAAWHEPAAAVLDRARGAGPVPVVLSVPD